MSMTYEEAQEVRKLRGKVEDFERTRWCLSVINWFNDVCNDSDHPYRDDALQLVSAHFGDKGNPLFAASRASIGEARAKTHGQRSKNGGWFDDVEAFHKRVVGRVGKRKSAAELTDEHFGESFEDGSLETELSSLGGAA